jgi:anti-sigma-K factor RskA
MLTCEQCRNDMAEYALGHTAPESSAAMAAHLDACVVCRREFAEVESAWSAMPLALDPIEPSPQVLDRLWERIGHTTISQPRAALSPASSGSPLTRRQRLWSYAVAAGVAAALVGGSLYLTRAPQEVAAGDAAAEQALRDLARRMESLREVEGMLNSGDVKLASLHAPNSADVGAYLVWDLVTDQWHFVAPNLSPAPPGQTYQLWAVAEGREPVAGPTFGVDARGLGQVVADFPTLEPGAPLKAVVTLEPASGSSAPTGATVLEAPL